MLGEEGTPLAKLQAAVREFVSRDERQVDLKEYVPRRHRRIGR